jgi:hypothetical protein
MGFWVGTMSERDKWITEDLKHLNGRVDLLSTQVLSRDTPFPNEAIRDLQRKVFGLQGEVNRLSRKKQQKKCKTCGQEIRNES